MKGILAAGTETDPAPPSTGDGGAAAHLHGPSQLFANVVALPTPTPTPAADHTTASVVGRDDAHDEHPDPGGPAPTEPHRLESSPTINSKEAS